MLSVSVTVILPVPVIGAETYIDRHLPRDENREPQSQSEALTEQDEDLEIPDEAPDPLTEIKPVFPEELQETGVAGVVLVKALVNILGKVEQTDVIEGPVSLRPYAVEAVAAASFAPARQNGVPVACWVHIPVSFEREGRLKATAQGNTNFVRNDRVLTWSSVNTGRVSISDEMNVSMNSNLSTSLNMSSGSGQEDRWYDTVFNEAAFEYAASDKVDIGLSAKEDWNRDTYSTVGTSLLTMSLDSTVRYRPWRFLKLNGGIGQLADRRFDQDDQGTTVNGGALLSGRPFDGAHGTVDIDGTTSNLKRTSDLLRIRSTFSYGTPLADISLGIDELRRNRGYFSDADRKRIEQREHRERSLSLNIARGNLYSYREETAFALTMNLGSSKLDDSANNNEQSSKYQNNARGALRDVGLVVARGIGGRIMAEFEGGYSFDDNEVDNPNRSRTQTDISLASRVGISAGKKDSLRVIGWIKRSRIDTPEGVPNDRDELKFEIGVTYTHNFTTNLETGLDFRALETHYVNIDASQSTQNKWIKTFQLSPSLVYRPVRPVRVAHRVNLYANHMEYDFDSATNPRSNITRRVSSETRLRADITSNTRVYAGFTVEENDYGNLDSRGRKLPVEEGMRRYGDIAVDYVFHGWITIRPLYSYLIRRDTDIDSDNVIRREIEQIFGIDVRLFEGSSASDYSFVLSLKRELRSRLFRSRRTRNYVDLNVRYVF